MACTSTLASTPGKTRTVSSSVSNLPRFATFIKDLEDALADPMTSEAKMAALREKTEKASKRINTFFPCEQMLQNDSVQHLRRFMMQSPADRDISLLQAARTSMIDLGLEEWRSQDPFGRDDEEGDYEQAEKDITDRLEEVWARVTRGPPPQRSFLASVKSAVSALVGGTTAYITAN